MFIFIDEAGTFTTTTKAHSVSCVAALVVPESLSATLFRRFKKLTAPWLDGEREIKGRSLNETEIQAVLKLLRRFDVLLIAVCVDMGMHTEDGIEAHKKHQAGAFLRAIRPRMPDSLKRDFEDLAARMEGLSNQLYVQATALMHLAHNVLHASTLYYVERLPQTLGVFKWRIDAKGTSLTNYEALWREVVSPFSQTMSLREPLLRLKGADYSAFARFEGTAPVVPAYLRPQLPDHTGPFQYVDAKRVLTENLQFSLSHRYQGLQVADVLANAIRRACNGTLQRKGWDGIGRLMPQPEKGRYAVRFIAIDEVTKTSAPYFDFLRLCDLDTKRMILDGREGASIAIR